MVTVHGSYVQFRFVLPGVQSVHLVGDFNGAKANPLQMVHTPGDCWLAVLRLPAGSYCFRYLADGRWHTDYAAFRIENSPPSA